MREQLRICFLGLIILALACGWAITIAKPVTAAKPIIDILAVTEVVGDEILLKDIAKLSDDSLQLEDVYVGSAALPGSKRRLTLGQIEVRLRQAGINPHNLDITGSDEVWVSTVSAETDLQDSNDNPSLEEQQTVSNMQSYQVNTYQVVVPVRNITRHELINREDLEIEVREGRTVPSNLADIDDLIGKRAVRLLTTGTYITNSAVEVPPVIERGDSVFIMAESGTVQVTAAGKALEAGGYGEIIRVENVDSRKTVYGQVIDSELVKVDLGGVI